MDNRNPNPAAQPFPWYDDRVEAVRKEYVNPWAEDDEPAEPMSLAGDPARYTPKEIYAYLDRLVWKQQEAKRAASIIMYQCLHGIRSTAMFIGPSGCGKTHVWRCLQFDSSQGMTNVRFEGLDGTESVASMKQALSLLKIKNPAVNFADAVKSGAYNDMSDAEYKIILDTITYISDLWVRHAVA